MGDNIWFTSDTHFFHKRIMEFCKGTRRGRDSDEMTELLVTTWNKQVGNNDTVYHLGDLSFANAEKTEPLLKRLNGKIHLVVGNHEKWLNDNTSKYMESVNDYLKIKIGGQKVIMFHYPIAEWDCMHHGSFHLYGHVHGKLIMEGRAIDVGIDARPWKDMKLWHWDEIVGTMKDLPIRKHHATKLKTVFLEYDRV